MREIPFDSLGDDAERWIAGRLVSARLFDDPLPAIGRYRVFDRIGRGAFGVVWKAHDQDLERDVALKLILRTADPQRHRASLREARILARLTHPHLATIHDVGEWRGLRYLVMTLVEGQPLSRWIETVEPSTTEILSAMVGVGRGLAAVHAAGLVHLDVKPENIFIGADGHATLLDFGVAVLEDEGLVSEVDALDADAPQTRPGGGTPRYMAPEQVRGESVGPPADQYSFALSLVEALERRLPARDPTQAVHRWSAAARSKVPRSVVRALSRALRAEPFDRFPEMSALVAQLEPSRQRRRWRAVSVVVGLGLTIGGSALWQWSHAPSCVPPESLVVLGTEGVPATATAAIVDGHPDPRPELELLDRRMRAMAKRWLENYDRACVAREPLDCFRWSRTLVEAHRDAILRADATTVRALAWGASTLEPPARCLSEGDAVPQGQAVLDRTAQLVVARVAEDEPRARSLASALLEDNELEPSTRVIVLDELGRLLLRAGELGEAEEVLLEGLAQTEATTPDIRAVTLTMSLFDVYLHQGRTDQARGVATAMATMVTRMSGEGRSEALINLGVAQARLLVVDGRVEDAWRRLESLAPSAESSRVTDGLVWSEQAGLRLELGDYRAAAADFARVARWFERRKGRLSLEASMSRYNEGWAAFLAGDLDHAIVATERARLDMGTQGLGGTPAMDRVEELYAGLRFDQGDRRESRALREAIWDRRRIDPTTSPADRLRAQLHLAESLIADGNFDAVLERLDAPDLPAVPLGLEDEVRGRVQVERARALRYLGQLSRAEHTLRPLVPWRESLGADACELRLALALELEALRRARGFVGAWAAEPTSTVDAVVGDCGGSWALERLRARDPLP